MTIGDSIKKARERGIKDERILQEIIKQNPDKTDFFDSLLKQGKTPTQILDELIRKAETRVEKTETQTQEKETKQPERKKPLSEADIEKEKTVSPPEPPKTPLTKTTSSSPKEEAKKKVVFPPPPPPASEVDFSRFVSKKPKIKSEEEIRAEETKRKIEELRKKLEEKSKLAEEKRKEIEEKKKEEKEQKPTTVFRPVPKGPTPRERLWIRVSFFALAVALLAAVSTFWYWYLVVRPNPPLPPIAECTTNADCPEGQICGPDKKCVAPIQIGTCTTNADCPEGQICGPDNLCISPPSPPEAPPSLFGVEDVKNITISSNDEIKDNLRQALGEWLEENHFRRIIIKRSSDNQFLGLKDFFEAMLIRVPEELYQKLENNFTLFIFSQPEGNRIGLAVRVLDPTNLENLLKNQESTMEDDFKTLFELMGKTGPAIVPYFRNASNVSGFIGPNFRYQSYTRKDLGLCYLVNENYFILTSSWKSMIQTIEKLEIPGRIVAITKDLKLGDRGDEVLLLQTWLKQDSSVYPEGKTTGFFGYLTKQAVIRFQEKYATDILAPQGLTKGTGIVDSYTRVKLNELYSKTGIIPTKPELTTDLRFGDHGNEVKLLQTWLAKDKKVYPEGITSGWFGPLTKQAVIRFQEKYATDILAPQGLSRGTGIVDALTRKKLNELYGE